MKRLRRERGVGPEQQETNQFLKQDLEFLSGFELNAVTRRLKIDKRSAEKRLHQLAEALGIQLEVLEEFPEEINLSAEGFISADDVKRAPEDYRFIKKGDLTIVVGLREDQYFVVDEYKEGTYSGGNHDMTMGELVHFLMKGE